MRYLILGCNGMAGHLISIFLLEQGHEVLGFARKKSSFVDTIVGDALDKSSLSHAVKIKEFDAIVNCIGILNENAEKNKSEAVYLNAYLPHFLAKLTDNTSTQVIHLSTDCVFSGKKKGGYAEQDYKDGESFYDRSKALGELDDSKNITLRTSIVGPDINENGIGLLNWFMKQEKTVSGYTKSIWTGQTTLQLAKTIEAASVAHVSGLYNVVPDKSISKYELLKLFNKYLRNDRIEILPIDGIDADKTLLRTNWNFDFEIPTYDDMLHELSTWMNSHRSIYSHYDFL